MRCKGHLWVLALVGGELQAVGSKIGDQVHGHMAAKGQRPEMLVEAEH